VAAARIDGSDCISSVEEPTHLDSSEGLIDQIERVVRKVIDAQGEPAAVGIGLPSQIDFASGTVVASVNIPLEGVPLGKELGERLKTPVHVDNDANCAALAEAHFVDGGPADHLVMYTLGTGVGGGVVIDGRLHLGAGHAGEIGHTIVEPDGPPCGCGNRGCLDRVAGAAAIATRAGRATVEDAITAARGGDARARAALEHAAQAVGVALGAAAVLLWPDRIVIGGGVAEAGELLLAPLRRAVLARARVCPNGTLTLAGAELGPAAGAIGAALWRHEA
jgi:glucokinase